MKLFGRTSGYYLFWTSFVYFIVGIIFITTKIAQPELATLCFVLVLSIPLWCPPVARYFNMEPLMFDFFRFIKKNGDDMEKTNVVKFPEPKSHPKMPEVEPPEPEPEKAGRTYYRLGLTDNNRVSFTMGYSEVTMNRLGIQNMIDQLSFYRDQLRDDEE